MLAARPCKERAVGGTEDRRLVAKVGIVQIDMRALIDRHQGRRHRDVYVLACPRGLAPVQRRQDRDCGLQPGIDIGMRQAVGSRLAQNLAIMADTVDCEPGLG